MFKKKDPLRKGYEILRDIRLLKDRVSRIQNKVDERASQLADRLVELQMRGDKYLSTKYAEEIARLKELSSRLSVVLFVLDKMDLAVQHAIIRNELGALAVELRGILRDVMNLPESRLPDVSIIFEELYSDVRELSEITAPSLTISYNPSSNSEIKAILEEAKEALRKRLEPAS